MRSLRVLFAASAVAGGLAFAGCNDDRTASTSGSNSGTTDVAVDSGEKTKPLTTPEEAQQAAARGEPTAGQEAIRETFAEVAEASLTKDGFDDIVERFVDADRNRFGQAMPSGDALAGLHGQIAEIQAAWKAKYNAEFDIGDENAVFGSQFMNIQVSELTRAAAGVDETEVKVDNQGNTDVDVDRKTGVDSPRSGAADTNLNDPGRNVATVNVAGSHGLPAVEVKMIRELGGWRIDVPDNMTATRFHELLLAHLTNVNQMKDQWPADQADAYRAVTHHVLMAVQGMEAK